MLSLVAGDCSPLVAQFIIGKRERLVGQLVIGKRERSFSGPVRHRQA
jgi:hypothetical protein